MNKEDLFRSRVDPKILASLTEKICEEVFDVQSDLYLMHLVQAPFAWKDHIHLRGVHLAGTATLVGLPPFYDEKDETAEKPIDPIIIDREMGNLFFSSDEIGTAIQVLASQEGNTFSLLTGLLGNSLIENEDYAVFGLVFEDCLSKKMMRNQVFDDCLSFAKPPKIIAYTHLLQIYALCKEGALFLEPEELIDLAPDTDMYPVLLTAKEDELTRRDKTIIDEEINKLTALVGPVPTETSLIEKSEYPEEIAKDTYELLADELLRIRRALF